MIYCETFWHHMTSASRKIILRAPWICTGSSYPHSTTPPHSRWSIAESTCPWPHRGLQLTVDHREGIRIVPEPQEKRRVFHGVSIRRVRSWPVLRCFTLGREQIWKTLKGWKQLSEHLENQSWWWWFCWWTFLCIYGIGFEGFQLWRPGFPCLWIK